jgi:hypothetical protein
MKFLYTLSLCLLLRVAGAQAEHVIFVIDSVPPLSADVQKALTVYKLRFENGNETDLQANYYTYAKMDSIYGKSWIKKLASSLKENKTWYTYLSNTAPRTIYTDNWNWTKYDFYSIGLIKETQTRSCGYNLRCGIHTKQYSRKGLVTGTKMKTVSKDK